MPETKERLKESESRQATIMFADISGFTAMSERMDPEDVTATMNECFSLMGASVGRYGGTIDKFIGDCMMVLFGVPAAIEDAPKKAVNAAIEIRNGLHRFNRGKKLKVPLDVHIGINTGTVVAGVVGTAEKKDYTVMGDAVNLASRLKDASGKGQIYVGPLTYRYTRNDFDYRELEPVSLKGREQPVTVFELLSVKEKKHRARPDAKRMVFSELVGREGELGALEAHVQSALDGKGFIVSVIGEAGIGKSRLMAELRRRELLRNVTFLEGRALSTGKNLSFHPIIDILQRWSGMQEEDTEPEAGRKLEQTIRTVHPEGADEVFPFIATLMGMKLAPPHAERLAGIEGEALEKLILVNLRALLAKAAEQRPVVFVVEDLHWADLSSLGLLEALFGLALHSRVLFISLFRPNYPDTGERLRRTLALRYKDHHAELPLAHLEEGPCQALIDNLLKIKGLPARVRQLISKRAEGNPFFIEEVVRSFIDDGVVEIKNGKFAVTKKIDTVVIPNTIQDLLMSRIDRLDEQSKALLKFASAIGRAFFYRVLVEVAESVGEIQDRLEYLKEIQLIRERSRMAEVEYLFQHALVQEATYESILLSQRREIHAKIAVAIEQVFSARLREFYGMLALHYSRAENLEKAGEFLVKAGEESLRAAASSEALHYYREALALYLRKNGDSADPEKIAGLEKNIALALYNKGHFVDAIEHFDTALSCWGVRRPAGAAGAALKFVSEFLAVLFSLYVPLRRRRRIPDKRDSEIVNLSEKRALALVQADTKRLFLETMGTLKYLGRFDLARVENGALIYLEGSGVFSFSGVSFRIARKILNHAKGHLDGADVKAAFFYKFNDFLHDFLSGAWTGDLDYDEALVSRYLKTGDVYHASAYMILCCLLRTERGEFDKAERLAAALAELGELYDHDYIRGTIYLVNSALFLKRRKVSEALKEADAGLSFLTRHGQDLLALFLSAIKANAHILHGDTAEAGPLLVQARDFMLRKKWIAPFYTGNLSISRSLFDLFLFEAARGRGDRERRTCARTARQSVRVAVKLAGRYAANRTEAFRLAGVFFWLAGKQDTAMIWFDRSVRTGERSGALPELARTYAEVGKRLREKDSGFRELNGAKAAEFLAKAEALFRTMDLEWDLKELAAVHGPGNNG